MNHPVDQIAAENSDLAVRLALTPVRCIDCEERVPLGWVEYGTVKCPKNIGASGVQYGHRVEGYVLTQIKDSLFNLASQA